jgi:hypothetical protein
VVLKRSPKGKNRGAVWLAVEEQAKVGIDELAVQPLTPEEAAFFKGKLPSELCAAHNIQNCHFCDNLECGDNTGKKPDLAAQMAADPEFVRRAEEGWKAIDEGRCTPLDEVKKKLDPP